MLNPSFQQVPDFLKEKGYKNPDQILDAPFHKAVDTDKPFFLWMQQNQDAIRYFHPSLAAFESPVLWTAVVPLAEILKDADKNVPIFVDVGGGTGAQCAAFRKATKEHFSGRVINQDLPQTIAEAPKDEDIEMMAQDFFQEQQIQGSSL